MGLDEVSEALPLVRSGAGISPRGPCEAPKGPRQ
jgi:hypothetical protein